MTTTTLCEHVSVPQTPPSAGQSLSETEPAYRRMQQYAELTQLPFFCVDVSRRMVLGKTDANHVELLPVKILDWLSTVSEGSVIELPSGLIFYALPLPDVDGSKNVAAGYMLKSPSHVPNDVVLMAAEQGWSNQILHEWLTQQHYGHPAMLKQLIRLAEQQTNADRQETIWLEEIDQLSEQIDRTYEEIALLHDLARNLNISRSPHELARLCLDRMHELIHARGHIIWLQPAGTPSEFLIEGDYSMSPSDIEKLIGSVEQNHWSQPLVKNQISGTLLGADFPELNNMVLVPIAEGEHRFGWILSCNLCGEREFGTVEASLLNSIATFLGTHLRNIDLYEQHEELMFSFVRSLVSTLDARDPYTRGHSERVALIARRLGEELNLPTEDQETIYQAGLLHDIGKIGINDHVLQKAGKLTDGEFEQIQQHPMIGYSILSGLKNLQNLLPGVRNHHETFSGGGYPDGLVGDSIPLMARIISVADAYDAMRSDRPYRKGMPLDRVEEIFHQGSGKQWDATVVSAYFRARDDLIRICQQYAPRDLIQREREHVAV